LLCGQCQRQPHALPLVRAPFCYQPPADHLVQALKYHGRLALAPELARLMLPTLARATDPRPELIVPVPLHPRRLRERGFNQALELARPLARALGIRLHSGVCLRVRDTGRQTGLDARQRRINVRGAFALRGPLPARRIALVDDVVTTGNTVRELARMLRAAGATELQVWAFARAAVPGP